MRSASLAGPAGVLAGALLVAAACSGGSTEPTEPTAIVPPQEAAPSSTAPLAAEPTTSAPTTSEPPPPTEPPPVRPSPLDAALDDVSLLTLGTRPSDPPSGRFRIEPGPGTSYLMPVEGHYWATEAGNVYTSLDVDTGAVAAGVTRLVGHLERIGGQPGDSAYLESLRSHYRGNEFQIGLAAVVRWIGAGPPPFEWMEQYAGFSERPDTQPPEMTACLDGIGAYDVALGEFVRGLDRVPVPAGDGSRSWRFPMELLADELAGEMAAAAVCDVFVETENGDIELRVAVFEEADQIRIEVFADRGIYTDRGEELELRVVMSPDAAVDDPPEDPDPAPLLTLRSTYLVAVAVCGELPWSYSNFAAADTYYSPESGFYTGPTIFESDWLCADEVPEGRRDDGE